MKNVLITIEYDGSGFHGWQIQPNSRTVQGELTKALSTVCGTDIHLNGTSRTDAGVHAYQQAATFMGNFGIPAERIPIAVNNLTSDVKILTAQEVPPDFHARRNATGKTYLYRISLIEQGETPDIFLRNYRYQLCVQNNIQAGDPSLSLNSMRSAAADLIGTHDFSSFTSAGGDPNANPNKTISDIEIASMIGKNSKGNSVQEYEIRITGDGFLYNMVRIIVGTLVEIGLGKRTKESMSDILTAKRRSAAGHTAPASGLWLERIYYDEHK